MTTEYKNRIRQCFADAYKYYEKHTGASTIEQFTEAWDEILAISDAKGDLLTLDLFSAVYGELSREEQRNRKEKANDSK